MLGALLQINKVNPLARPETVWFAVGTVVFLLGTLYFFIQGWDVEDPEAREYYVITILIPAIAAASYFTMFTGFGLKEVSIVGGPTLDIYWARYVDWLFTTPLLLLDLALLADADRATILTLVGLDGFMIVTGLWATLENVFAWRYLGWLFSEVALLFILYYLFTILTKRVEAMGEDRAATFRTLRNLTVILWFIYPIWWLVGTEGAGLVPLFVESLGFMVLDVTAKVGFGFLLLRSRAIFGAGGGSAPRLSVATPAASAGGSGTRTSGAGDVGEPDTTGSDPYPATEVDETSPDTTVTDAESDGDDAVDYEALVADNSVPEVKSLVEDRDLDPEATLAAEESGENRVTLTRWLRNRIEEADGDADANE